VRIKSAGRGSRSPWMQEPDAGSSALSQLVLSGSATPTKTSAVARSRSERLAVRISTQTLARVREGAEVVGVPVNVVLVIWWAAPGANPDALSVTVPPCVTG
jgi:hypothetical protein